MAYFRDDEMGLPEGGRSVWGLTVTMQPAQLLHEMVPYSLRSHKKKMHIKDILDSTLLKNTLAPSSLSLTGSHDCESIYKWLWKR